MCRTLKDTSILCKLIRSHQCSLTSCSICKRTWIKNLPTNKNTFWELSLLSLSLSLLVREKKADNFFISEITSEFCRVGLSHGNCPVCLSSTKIGEDIRRRQKAEGNFPCFGTARRGFCDQVKCKYRKLCIWPEPWSQGVLPEEIDFHAVLAERVFRKSISVNTVSENIERVAISLSPP